MDKEDRREVAKFLFRLAEITFGAMVIVPALAVLLKTVIPERYILALIAGVVTVLILYFRAIKILTGR